MFLVVFTNCLRGWGNAGIKNWILHLAYTSVFRYTVFFPPRYYQNEIVNTSLSIRLLIAAHLVKLSYIHF